MKREVYDVLKLMGEFGGFIKVLISSVTLLLLPITEFLYVLHLTGKLYFAETKGTSPFKQTQFTKKSSSGNKHSCRISKYISAD